MPENQMLSLHGVESGYGDYTVLRDVSLEIDDSELVSVIGPNGAGKTTLLKTIIGLVKPKKGEITFVGKKITGKPPRDAARMGIGYVPQGGGTFTNMTVEENIEAGAYILSDKSIVAQRMRQVLDLFPRLKERLRSKAFTLSGGERQMLLLARALMLDPKLILLDEPSVGLDPKMQSLLYGKIKDLKESGKTIILVEQNVRKALELANHCYLIEVGRIVYKGTPEQISSTDKVKEVYLGV